MDKKVRWAVVATCPRFGTSVALFATKRAAVLEYEKVFDGETAVYLMRVDCQR